MRKFREFFMPFHERSGPVWIGPDIPVYDDDISFNEQMHKLIYIRDSFHVILFKY